MLYLSIITLVLGYILLFSLAKLAYVKERESEEDYIVWLDSQK